MIGQQVVSTASSDQENATCDASTLRQCLDKYRRQTKYGRTVPVKDKVRANSTGEQCQEEAGAEEAAPCTLHQVVSELQAEAGAAAPAVIPRC